MGGAVVVEYAKNYANPNTLLGICMIDVVEGAWLYFIKCYKFELITIITHEFRNGHGRVDSYARILDFPSPAICQ